MGLWYEGRGEGRDRICRRRFLELPHGSEVRSIQWPDLVGLRSVCGEPQHAGIRVKVMNQCVGRTETTDWPLGGRGSVGIKTGGCEVDQQEAEEKSFVKVTSHEMGHNNGVGHGSFGAIEYGDPFTLMGAGMVSARPQPKAQARVRADLGGFRVWLAPLALIGSPGLVVRFRRLIGWRPQSGSGTGSGPARCVRHNGGRPVGRLVVMN